MKLPRTLILSMLVSGGALLAACDQLPMRGNGEPPPPVPADLDAPPAQSGTETDPPVPAEPDLPVRPEATASSADIDWDAARRDLASRPIETREGAFQIESGVSAPPVPLFLPSSPVTAQSGEGGMRLQPTRDGYFAFFPGDAWDAIVNGSNRVITAPGETVQPRGESFNFQPTTTGAQVSFSRYGADYLVEFECKALTNGLPACITEEDAVAFAQDLVISGTR